jgi:small subunit ribosomal protein S16
LVAVDSRSPRGGSSLENVGTYDPRKGVEAVTLKEERIKHWLKEGAKPSRTVDEILRRAKIL